MREQQGGDLRDQAVADAEQAVGVDGLGDGEVVLEDADGEAADRLMAVMMMAAMASPRTNLEAPSMAP